MRDVDYTASVAFLRKFFAHTQGNVELRAIGSESGNEKPDFTRDTERVEEFCQRNDEPGTAIYFGCATRIVGHSRGKRANLAEIICAFIDIDTAKHGLEGDEVVAVLRGCPCPPSIIVLSGHGLHVYWLLHEPIDVTGWGKDEDEAYTALLKRLVGCFAGDDKCTDLPRVMRLPGTHNSKKTEAEPEGGWRQCRVLVENDRRYELGDLAEMLDQLEPGGPLIVAPGVDQGGVNSVPFNQPNIGDPFAAYGLSGQRFDMGRLDRMSHQDAENPIHATRIAAAASLVQKGEMDDGEIFDLLLAATVRAAGVAGQRWNWRQEEKTIQEEIASAHKKWPAPPAKVVELRPGQQARPEPDAEPAPEFMGYPLNDLGNAARLLAAHKDALRYVLGIEWHVWDRRRFKHDPEAGKARRLAHDTVKTMLLQAWKAGGNVKSKEKIVKFAIQCANSGRLANMLHEAEPYQAIEAGDLDRDPMLLNCLNGTVDLRTGVLRPHAQADLLSKLCNASYDADAACPQWEKFVSEIFGGDVELVGFVQRAFGYSLTGSTKEQVLFIMHGSGSNGKTVLIETIQAVLGDYIKRSPADTWASKPAGALTNDVAALVGARLVSVVETEQDRHLAEALVKQASGGDTITARFHHKEFFSFIPQFKLWFATNHRPKIKGSDYAIWRRIHLLPFTVKFVDADKVEGSQRAKDPDLMGKLKLEHNGILAWMVRGCLEWQRVGLKPPEAVKTATEAYQDSQDNVTGFVRDCCHQSRGIQCANKLLYGAYELWCEENDEEMVSKQVFAGKLDEQGFPPGKRTNAERQRQGIDINGDYKRKLAEKAEKDKPKT